MLPARPPAPPRLPPGLLLAVLVLAATLMGAASPLSAATLAIRQAQNHEQLTITLDEAPSLYNLLRDSRTSLTLALPPDYWKKHPRPATLQPRRGKLLRRVEPTPQGLRIELVSPAFGFIHQLDGKTLTVDVFADPLGARWEPAPQPAANATPPAFTEQPTADAPPVTAKANATASTSAAANATANATAAPRPRATPPSISGPIVSGPITPSPLTPGANASGANLTGPTISGPITPRTAVSAPAAAGPNASASTASGPSPSGAIISGPITPRPAEPGAPAPVPALSRPWNLRAPVLLRELGDPMPGGRSVQAAAPAQPPAPTAPPTPAAPPIAPPAAAPPTAPPAAALPPAPLPVLPPLPAIPPLAQNATPSPVLAQNATPAGNASLALAPDPAPDAATNASSALVESTRTGRSRDPNEGWILTADEALKALEPREPAPGEEQNASKPYVPDFDAVINSARAAMVNGDHDDAIAIFDALRVHPKLPKRLVEEVLYSLADAHFIKAKEDYRTHYDTLTSLLIAAMNQNPRSPRTPEALLKLGLINLRVGNAPEADAYFAMLLREFPNDPSVPLVYYYQGKNFFDQGKFQEAADKFQYVVQQFPDSRHVREAAVGLAEALYKLGYDTQALQIVDYIDKRWPRFYVEYPPILKLGGEVAARNQAWERARANYWTYYNLSPDGDDADITLARIGDVYLGQNSTAAAREIYQQCAARYPGKDGALISLMRLAENGVHDTPSVEEMFTVFDRPFSTQPADIYQRILSEHPESSLAPLARLKLAMWRLFNTREREALADVETFLKDYPQHELTPQAMEVAGQAFQAVIANHVGQENYPGIVVLCNEHPMIAEKLDRLPPTTQTAMALAFWKTGQPARALSILEPLLARPGMPEESEMALQLATTIHLENRAWDKIVALHELVQDWELSPKIKDEFDYALALAYENLQSPDKSQAIWEELADKKDLGVNRIAYTKYFLAIEARKRENLKAAYEHGMDALSYFLESGEDPGKVMDLLHLLMDVSDVAGRPRDALKWAIEFGNRLDPADTRWPAMRYRTAQLYKKVQDEGQWRAILEELASQLPNSPFGRMAAMDLKGAQLEEGVSQYTPPPPL
ncbi:putative tetratricopeptide domain-containing protein [Megalodesulfovibrio gigas DSM 1382 = ATCC 19364]|uniref:Putative tetratricopeptide domain-containing protein n=2 Tax=Megalodesulfovibrio gigas TaxID=879 RepID=T2G841_MEGG1|nr:putative tetratricopeptide domain-containing protein [Megalodesulfovibrio gigas DSM 1382 = ATCC 19364]